MLPSKGAGIYYNALKASGGKRRTSNIERPITPRREKTNINFSHFPGLSAYGGYIRVGGMV